MQKIKTELDGKSNPDGKVYPKIMISDLGTNLVVLFTEHKKGVVISSNKNNVHKFGYFTDDWSMDSFSPYKGSITINVDAEAPF